jgi:hypothetical protein
VRGPQLIAFALYVFFQPPESLVESGLMVLRDVQGGKWRERTRAEFSTDVETSSVAFQAARVGERLK